MSAVAAWTQRHLVYTNQERTHEVHAEVQARGVQRVLVTTEFPAGSRDPREMMQRVDPVPTAEALQKRLDDLESALSLTGAYWRADVADMAWAPVAPPQRPQVDLRAHEFPLPGAQDPSLRIQFHHFHGGRRDRLFVSLPRQESADRFVLADLEFEFPKVADGEVRIVHPRLHGSMLQARIAETHLELPRQGYQKLVEPQQYERAYGTSWLQDARSTFAQATRLVVESRAVPPPPVPAMQVARFSPLEIQRALQDPRVHAACAHFLDDAEAGHLLESGELGIRRWVSLKRRRLAQTEQYALTIAEAALLTRWAMRGERRAVFEEEGAKLVRFVRAATGR